MVVFSELAIKPSLNSMLLPKHARTSADTTNTPVNIVSDNPPSSDTTGGATATGGTV